MICLPWSSITMRNHCVCSAVCGLTIKLTGAPAPRLANKNARIGASG